MKLMEMNASSIGYGSGGEPDYASAAIEAMAEQLMSDESWIEATLEDGGLGESKLVAAIAAAYQPGVSMTIIGGLLMDILWEKAHKESEEWEGDYDGE